MSSSGGAEDDSKGVSKIGAAIGAAAGPVIHEWLLAHGIDIDARIVEAGSTVGGSWIVARTKNVVIAAQRFITSKVRDAARDRAIGRFVVSLETLVDMVPETLGTEGMMLQADILRRIKEARSGLIGLSDLESEQQLLYQRYRALEGRNQLSITDTE